jgi:hypothetical protein
MQYDWFLGVSKSQRFYIIRLCKVRDSYLAYQYE